MPAKYFHAWVKSAPINACSIPIHTVIGINNCWLGFLHWFNVADNKATPDNSFADSEPFRFSPYLWYFRIISWFLKNIFYNPFILSLHTWTMDPRTMQWKWRLQIYKPNKSKRSHRFPHLVAVQDCHFQPMLAHRNWLRTTIVPLQKMIRFHYHHHREHRLTTPDWKRDFPKAQPFARPRRRSQRIAQWSHRQLDR